MTLFFVFLTSSAIAQEPVATPSTTSTPVAEAEESKFRLGPIIGLNASTAVCNSCESAGVTGRLGLAGGVAFELLFGKWMALELEAMYLQKGARIDNFTSPDVYFNYETIEIPVHFKGRFGNERVKGVVFAGPQMGIAITRSQDSGSTSSRLQAKSLDFGFHVGGGAEWQLDSTVNLFVNGRFNFGLANLDDGFIGERVRSFGILGISGVKFGL